MEYVPQAVILAAGASTRTHPLTVERPKPLLPILNRPLLSWSLQALEGLVEEVILVVGFRQAMIRAAFGARFGRLRLRYVEQREPLGTGDALRRALPLLGERFFVLNGDDLIARRDLEALAAHPQALLTTVMDDPRAFSVVELDERGCVIRIVEKPDNPPPGAQTSIGFYLMGPEARMAVQRIRLSSRGEYELTDVAGMMPPSARFRAVPVRGYWLPIGYPWKLLEATRALLEREAPPLPHLPGVELEAPLVVGEGVRIAPGARIGPYTVLGAGVEVAQGAVVRESIVMEGARIDALARVEASVIGPGAHIGAGARLLPCRPPCTESIRSTVRGAPMETGLHRLGAMLGDGVEIGADAVLMPGVKVWPGCRVGVGECVNRDRMDN